MAFKQGSELISFVNYKDDSGVPRWEVGRRRVGLFVAAIQERWKEAEVTSECRDVDFEGC